MKITWLGHSGFRIEIADQILLIDPWLTGNPSFPDSRRAEAITGATHILLTHCHGDHASEAAALSRELGIPVCGGHELQAILGADGAEAIGFGKGGTITLGGVKVTMVHAVHSASIDFGGGPPRAGGSEAGYMIAGEGHVIYVSGDTDVMADMGIFAELHAPDIGILCCGGHYTMDIERAAFAARKFFDFKMVLPCHYGTFPLLAQSAEPLAEALPEVDVRLPAVMEVVEI